MADEDLKRAKTEYYHAMEGVTDILVGALCDTYRTVTGTPASDRLRDKLHDAVRFET